MGTFNQIAFVRDEIAKIPGISSTPSGGVGRFLGRVGQAGMLALREKEILVFALLQWLVIALAYLLWVQMLDWIPEEVWRSAAESDKGSVADLVLLATGVVLMLLRPVYVLALCDLYSDHLQRRGETVTLPEPVPVGVGAFFVFSGLCFLLAVVFLFRHELGVMDLLAVPYGR